MIRSQRAAAAIAAALLAGASAWVLAQASDLLIWAAFIGWASYDSLGAGRDAVAVSTVSLFFGVAMAWIVATSVAGDWLSLSADLASGIAAGVASLLIVSASRLHAIRAVPSTFMGLASTFAFLSLVDGADTADNLTSFGWDNAGIAVAVSLVIGTGLGIAHGELARLLSAPPQEKKTRKPRLRLDGSSHQSEPTDATTLSQEA